MMGTKFKILLLFLAIYSYSFSQIKNIENYICTNIEELNDYSDINDKIRIIDNGICNKDYQWNRDTLKIICKNNFYNLQSDVKDIVVKYCAIEQDTIISYLIYSKNINQQDAIFEYLKIKSIQIKNSANSYCKRLEDYRISALCILYLGEVQSIQFFNDVKILKDGACHFGLLGTNYNDEISGIMDYIESTGDYANDGLKKFKINSDIVFAYGNNEELARQDLITKIKDIIIYGK